MKSCQLYKLLKLSCTISVYILIYQFRALWGYVYAFQNPPWHIIYKFINTKQLSSLKVVNKPPWEGLGQTSGFAAPFTLPHLNQTARFGPWPLLAKSAIKI